jgi:UDPglucose 6-dehydrogenase
MEGADALAILTEWNEFRALDLARVKTLLKAPVVIEFRNIYNPEEMAAAGFRYSSIGRPGAGRAQAPASRAFPQIGRDR